MALLIKNTIKTSIIILPTQKRIHGTVETNADIKLRTIDLLIVLGKN